MNVNPEQINPDEPDGVPLIDEVLNELPDSLDVPSVKPEEPAKEEVVRLPNAMQCYSINMPEQAVDSEIISLPSDLARHAQKAIDTAPNINLVDSAEGRRWNAVLLDGNAYNTQREVFVPSLDDPEEEFRNDNRLNNQSLNSDVPRFKEKTGENLKGDRALYRAMSHLGMGTFFQTSLWHSGIWVTFKPPLDSELIELTRLIEAEKIKYGRDSYGLMYSNFTAFIVDKLVDFALNHVYDLTTKEDEINISNLSDHIVAQDIQSFLWGFICTMYPRGFQYERACCSKPGVCNHVVRDTLNVRKLQYPSLRKLTEWQKTFMSGRQAKAKTVKDVQRYKEEMSRLRKSRITLNEGDDDEISFTLKSPTIKEYVASGHEWIASIIQNVTAALEIEATNQERERVVELHGKATVMRQYACWVESIEFQGNIVDDRESVDRLLDTFSRDDRIRVNFTQKVIDYINTSTMTVIGIPVFECPACGEVNEGNKALPHHTNVIPLDVLQTFFGLILQKLEKIKLR